MSRILTIVGIVSGLGAAVIAQRAPSSGLIPTDDGLRLAYRIDGKGREPIFVLHGGPGGSSAYLRPDLLDLASDHQLISYDQRGTGESSVTSDALMLTIEKHIGDLETVRNFFDLHRVTLLGHSWGAGLAAMYAMRHPGRVRRLMLVDAMPPRRSPYLEEFVRNRAAWMDAAAKQELSKLAAARQDPQVDPVAACRAFWAMLIRGYVADPTRVPSSKGDVCEGPAEGVRNQVPVGTFTMQSLGDWNWLPQLKTISAPTLVVHGDRDPIPPESAREWTRHIPGARLLVIRGSGHLPFLEQPELFFTATREFLRGRWPNGAISITRETDQ